MPRGERVGRQKALNCRVNTKHRYNSQRAREAKGVSVSASVFGARVSLCVCASVCAWVKKCARLNARACIYPPYNGHNGLSYRTFSLHGERERERGLWLCHVCQECVLADSTCVAKSANSL